MTIDFWLFPVILFTGMFYSVKKEKLTLAGSVTGGIIGILVFIGAHFTGIAMLGAFFLSGTLATSFKLNEKVKLGVAEKNRGKRTAAQVMANSALAGMAGLLSWFYPEWRELFQLMMAASLASATADTISSELGTLYGKRFYNILSFQPDRRGDNGVVSIEGTILGILGSMLIAVINSAGFGWNSHFAFIILAGTAGNFADSVLGATLEKKQFLPNDAVNFINTLVAALFAWLLTIIF